MYCFRLTACVMAFASCLLVFGAGPDDRYVQIYHLIEQANELTARGQKDLGAERYEEAYRRLKQLQAGYPDWNPSVIQFRLKFVANRLESLAPAQGRTETPGMAEAADEGPAPIQPADRSGEIPLLRERVRQLEAEKMALDRKLKEAWQARPAASDPEKLREAESKILMLEKERDLLQAALNKSEKSQDVSPTGEGSESAREALAAANRRLKEQATELADLRKQYAETSSRLKELEPQLRNLAALREESESLKSELKALQEGGSKPDSGLRAELESVRAALRTNQTAMAGLNARIRELQEQGATLRSENESLRQQLERSNATETADAGGDSGERIRALEEERDRLQRKLADATRDLYAAKTGEGGSQFSYLTNQLATLRARLEVFEAERVPYTSEELALMQAPELNLAEDEIERRPRPERRLPSGAAALLREAEIAFRAGRYEDAIRSYEQILKLDEDNVLTLRNIAAALFQLGRIEEAEESLNQALNVDPLHADSLSLLGIIRFRQGNFEEALDLLSRAARLDPKNPETQNYLGITLSQQGHRAPAETALRKAVQLAPNYGGAHYNLSVVYATQKPPFLELARWHYQKAMAAGHSPNPEVEEILARRSDEQTSSN